MVPGRGDRKPQLAFCVGETSGQMWRPDTAIFTRANRQRFYFRFTVHCENSLDGAFDSETGDAQERLLSSGNNGGVKNIFPILQLSTLSSCVNRIISAAATAYPVVAVRLLLLNANMRGIVLRSGLTQLTGENRHRALTAAN